MTPCAWLARALATATGALLIASLVPPSAHAVTGQASRTQDGVFQVAQPFFITVDDAGTAFSDQTFIADQPKNLGISAVISNHKDRFDRLLVDDVLIVTITRPDGTVSNVERDFSNGCSGRVTATQALDMTPHLQPGQNRVRIQIQDKCGGAFGAPDGLWFVGSPNLSVPAEFREHRPERLPTQGAHGSFRSGPCIDWRGLFSHTANGPRPTVAQDSKYTGIPVNEIHGRVIGNWTFRTRNACAIRVETALQVEIKTWFGTTTWKNLMKSATAVTPTSGHLNTHLLWGSMLPGSHNYRMTYTARIPVLACEQGLGRAIICFTHDEVDAGATESIRFRG